MFKFDKNKIEQIKQGRKVEVQHKDISEISLSQIKQDDDITSNFIANAEIYEMLLNQNPVDELNNISTFSIAKSGGESGMVEVYVALILRGKKAIEEVPAVIREQVRIRCKELEIPVE
ncbi:CD1375 family protein [Clostridioides difficile]